MTTSNVVFDPQKSELLAGCFSDSNKPATLYINGTWQPADSGEVRTITNPADGSVVGVVSEAGEHDTERAIAVARETFDRGEWLAVPAVERGKILLKVGALLREHKDEFARAESADTGKRLAESELDMDDIANAFDYFGTLAQHEAGRVVDPGDPNVRSRIDVEPVGVCGLITPWNYPLLQVSWKVAPALAAGNTFVLKQAELTPHTAMMLMTLFERAGVPAGVANLITGAGANCGNPLSTSPLVDMVSFTGGLVTGRLIARNAAETVKRVALELGGKNPNVIFADADFDAAVDNALNGAFVHSGQVCSAGSRIVVEESIHDRFVEELTRRAAQIKLGGPLDTAAETGPLISLEHRDKVDAYVVAAKDQGATITTGGRVADASDNEGSHATGNTDLAAGAFYLPTIIDNCTRDMDCVHDEAFGPTVTVETFRTEEEAIAIANDTEYGLAGAVWTQDAGKAERVARKLRHGTIWINDFHPYLPQAEWGGMKQSGNGRELGPTGLAEYQEHKHVYQNIAPAVTGWFAG
ncbi:aldehyde dehydrogenase family protein [Corynebacterium diphtheriae]|uniref:aldehyde dehydrogenase family protein n=1 Tax=Corynebacterium diphtheriae TaxID=1717 RepID=UPI0013CA330D|nr:aldehyde dehydrogenase family protein [Corynebacterium diphtheriae]MBG9292945.1 aldehyde dehydrogenase family protein [Corynebacterium diphtheriae bv. gravis]MBG9374117.1 aldehyde dehydrogenase family protein [Corynebacterium diphtheriae bv. gravis]CAB0713471.1 betaine-aldehyde dehydrogenase [Corynebacterium diphtheriae]